MKLNGTHLLLVYADDGNILGENVHAVQEKAEALIVTSKEIGEDVTADKSKFMVTPRNQNAGRSHRVEIKNNSFGRVEELKYLGTTITDQVSIKEEIKSRFKSGIASCHLVQNLLFIILLYNNLKIKIYRPIILPVFLYGCETWSLTLKEERRLWVFENWMLRRIFGSKRDEVTREWRKLHNEELNDLYSSPSKVG